MASKVHAVLDDQSAFRPLFIRTSGGNVRPFNPDTDLDRITTKALCGRRVKVGSAVPVSEWIGDFRFVSFDGDKCIEADPETCPKCAAAVLIHQSQITTG
jgi:hypothetical protein